MQPLVSVLLPFRDAAETIDEAISSLLLEHEVPIELLALDDGSCDDGASRVAAIARRDPRVRLLAGEGRGIVSALTRALGHARGRFIARMDGDDVSMRGRIARQLDALERDGSLALIATRVQPFPEARIAEGLARYVSWQNGLVSPADHAREIFIESPVCHPSVMLRRDALEAVGGWRETRWAEDYDLWLRLDAAGYSMAKLPDVLLRWRQRDGRLTFTDARYDLDRFAEARATYLPARLRAIGANRSVVIWGAGPTGKRLGRALESHGVRADSFVDIDPRKTHARGVPVTGHGVLRRAQHVVIVAVGARGARELIRPALNAAHFVEGEDYLFAS